MKAVPDCCNKARLQAEYQAASEAYSKAISALSGAVGRAIRIEFEGLNVLAQRARMLADARESLEMHTHQHGC